ncbi:hypothetical protein MTO96_029679 [Rhipicephalus appendiculatus]
MDDATVPHCRQHPTRSSNHEHLRRAFLQDRDNQVIVLPDACVRRSGMSEWSTTSQALDHERAVPCIDIPWKDVCGISPRLEE